MRKIYALALTFVLLFSHPARAQFSPGETLTASALNFALGVKTTNTAAAITGGTINGVSIGASTPGTVAATTLSTSGLATLNGLSVATAPTFSAPLGLASGGTGQATATAAAHALGLGTTDTPTFYGLTVNGSTQHGLVIGGGNGNPVTYTGAGTSGQALLSGGASADPAFGALTLSALATQSANTVLANATGSPTTPTAFVMPGCSSSTNALQWASGAGFACNSAVNAATLGGATFAAPGAIGGSTAAAGTFTALTATSSFSAPYALTLNAPSATTITGKLNQIVDLTDFQPACNGTTNDDTAVSNAISSIGSTRVTLVISCPVKIAAAHTFSPNTQLWFKGGGGIIGTAGTENVQVQQQIIAGRTQIFTNVAAQADVGMTVYPEWWGGNQTVSDASAGFNSAYGFLANVGGKIQMAAGTYSIQAAINNVKSKVGLYGAGQNATLIKVVGTNISGITAAGTSGTPLSNLYFSDFNIQSNTPGTTNTGITLQYTALARLSNIQVMDFIQGVYMQHATNSFFTQMGATYSASTNGFIGWVIDGGGTGAGGNESSTWRDTYVSGTGAYGGPTGQIGYKAYGAYVSDLYFSNAATAGTNYGYYLDYSSATAGGYADVIIHNPVVDGFTTQGIYVNALPAQQMLTISDGWIDPISMLAETDGVYCNACIGSLTVTGTQFSGEANYAYDVGVRLVNSTDARIVNNVFNDHKYSIEETGSSRNIYLGNVFYNTSAHAGAVQLFISGSTGSTATQNVFDGYATYGAQIDGTSSGVKATNNSYNYTNLTNPISDSGTGIYVTASTSGTAITTGATINATSTSVPAGVWDCAGQALFLPAASTIIGEPAAGITTTSVTLPGGSDTTYLGSVLATGTAGTTSINTFTHRFTFATATTVYVVAEASSVTGSTATVNGSLQCRRVN